MALSNDNQSSKTPGSDPPDKTDMGKVKRVSGGAVDSGGDSKPKIPAEADRLSK